MVRHLDAWGERDGTYAAAWESEGFIGSEDDDWAWPQFAVALNAGLRNFTARVEYTVKKTTDFTFGTPPLGLVLGPLPASCLT